MTKHFATTLGAVCEFRYGKPLPAEARRGGAVAVYGSNGVVGHHDEPLVRGPSIVIGRKGSFGEVHYSPTDSWPIDTTYFIDKGSTEADLRWLAYALKASRLKDLNKAAAVPGLNRNDAYRLPILLPPLNEQRRIVAILDTADALRQNRKRAIALLDSLRQSIFLEMFGDPESNPLGWPEVLFGELILEGPTNGLYRPASEYGSGTPIVRIDAFYDGVITGLSSLKRLRIDTKTKSSFAVTKDDIVINRVNSLEYLGKSAIVPELTEPTVFESNMMRIRVDIARVTPGYCVSLLQTDFIKKQIARSAKKAVNQASINQTDVKSFITPLPPMTRQIQFDAVIAQIGHMKDGISPRQVDNLFASLQHRAFVGDL